MAVFSVIIADEDASRVITALCANYGYQANIPNSNFDPSLPIDPSTNPETISNPETPNKFANRMTRNFIMENTVAYELNIEKENIPQPTPPDIQDDDS